MPIPRGALPIAIEGVRRVTTSIPITGMVVAGTLMVGDVSPAMVEPI